MTLVTGTVQDLGYDGMEGTLWARPARFRSDGSVVLAPERKPFKITGGVVSAELAPGPAVLELQVGSHARGTFEVVIPEEDTTLADLLDTVFPWEPAQISLFVAEREAAEQAAADAEAAAGQAATAAGTATSAAQQTGQDRSHVDQVAALLDDAYDQSQAGMALPPRLMESALNATYAGKDDLDGKLDAADGDRLFLRSFTTGKDAAFAQGMATAAGINPPSVLGVDPVTNIIYAVHRGNSTLAMSGNKGVTWSGGGLPAGVNTAQVHKVVRFGAHIYLHAICGLDGRAGVYRAPAPTSPTQTIAWETANNLIANSNFNDGLTGWVLWLRGVTLTNPTDGGLFGQRYARLTVTEFTTETGPQDVGVALASNATETTVTEGQQFAISAWVRGTPGRRARIRVPWGGGGTLYGTYVTTDGTWQRVTATGTVPAGKTSMRPDILLTETGIQVGDTMDVDGVMFEMGTQTPRVYTPQGSAYRVYLMPRSNASGPNWDFQNGKATCLNASDDVMMLCDYGQDFVGGPSIHRTYDGVTWEKVWQVASSRHCHGVAADPYRPGHWWATVGDGSANKVTVLHSPDEGDTWEVVHGQDGNIFQSVQISFDAKYVYLAADYYGASAFYLDRDEKVIRNLNFGSHTTLSVPGGAGARVIDITTTAGSRVVTSPDLTPYDRGRTIESDNTPALASGAHIAEPNWLSSASAGTANMRKEALVSGTTQALIGGDRFIMAAYMGAVDPATGVYYFASMDTSSAGNTYGIFAIPHPGATPVVLDVVKRVNTPPTAYRPLDEVFIHDGMVYCGIRRFPTLAA